MHCNMKGMARFQSAGHFQWPQKQRTSLNGRLPTGALPEHQTNLCLVKESTAASAVRPQPGHFTVSEDLVSYSTLLSQVVPTRTESLSPALGGMGKTVE